MIFSIALSIVIAISTIKRVIIFPSPLLHLKGRVIAVEIKRYIAIYKKYKKLTNMYEKRLSETSITIADLEEQYLYGDQERKLTK